jgi:hypothetical protein
MDDPFETDAAKPGPDEPTPAGVTPNKPKDPSVYGTQWGDSGGQRPVDGPNAADRPAPITKPSEAQGEGDGDTEPPNLPP